MRHKAVLLTGDNLFGLESRAARLLEFFGVGYDTQRATDFTLTENAEPKRCYRIIGTAQTFESVTDRLRNCDRLEDQIHSVFLFSNGDPVNLSKVVSQLTGSNICVRRGAKTELEWAIADDPDGLHGAMRGLRVRPEASTVSSADFFEADEKFATSLIASGNKAAFLKLSWRGVPVLIASVPPVNIDADLISQNFDVRDHLFDAVPFVSYLRWAFGGVAWHAPEANACLVIDDPLLKAKYGFVCYGKLLELMKQLRFSTSIAFIPWNWRRSKSTVVQLFKENCNSYSICVHGCDHTAGEFDTPDRQRASSLANEALRRMSLHKDRTGLGYDPVMVFPQGLFSEEAMIELKRAGFTAVVNTELNANPPLARKLKISDAWGTAVMRYGDLPIYTRRYPSQGLENFAFDLLVGKPCIVVIHHDFCNEGYSRLAEFIRELNVLRVPLAWRSLGELLKRSYCQKQLTSDLTEIEMYCNEAVIENRLDRPKKYVVRRLEHHPESIESLCAGLDQLSWKLNGDYIQFGLELQPGESILVTLRFKAGEAVAYAPQGIFSSANTMLRRFLSEARDKYLTPARARIGAFSYV